MHAALWRRGVDPLKVDPWYFPTPLEYRRLLEAVRVVTCSAVLEAHSDAYVCGLDLAGQYLKSIEVEALGYGLSRHTLRDTKIRPHLKSGCLSDFQLMDSTLPPPPCGPSPTHAHACIASPPSPLRPFGIFLVPVPG